MTDPLSEPSSVDQKQRISEAAPLWPEAEGAAARNSFNNALCRLRKLLGGERHALLRGGSTHLDAASCWTDVSALEACYDEAELAHDAPALVVIADRGLGLYASSFLAGDDEHAAVLAAHQSIQARFIRRIGAFGAALKGAAQAERAPRASTSEWSSRNRSPRRSTAA